MRSYKGDYKTQIAIENTYQGEGLEAKLRRITETKEPIEAFWPAVYTNKKDGVLPGYDIRTDRFEVAREAMEKATQYGQRKEAQDVAKGDGPNGETSVGQESS